MDWSSLAAHARHALDALLRHAQSVGVPPEGVVAIAAASALVIAALVLLVARRRGASRAPAGRPARQLSARHAEVIALARRGADAAAIARRTGLSYDAVSTILRAFPAEAAPHADAPAATKPARHSRPRSAGISFPRRLRA